MGIAMWILEWGPQLPADLKVRHHLPRVWVSAQCATASNSKTLTRRSACESSPHEIDHGGHLIMKSD